MAKATEKKAVEEVVETTEATTEVAVAEEKAVAAASTTDLGDYGDLGDLGFDLEDLEDLTGLDSINASDIRVPYGKLYAKVATGRELGDIELPDGRVIKGKDGEKLEELSILKIQTVRVMFPQPFKKTNSFTCRSLDGLVGADDGEYKGTKCVDCAFSKFPEAGGSSPCREQILLLCTLPEIPMFYLLVSGIGVSEFKRTFMSVEMLAGIAKVKKSPLKKGILGALNLTMSVVMEETDYGPFPKPIFRVDRERPLVSRDRLIANLDSFSSYKEFEKEAVESAATFAKAEQGDYAETVNPEDEPAGENKDIF